MIVHRVDKASPLLMQACATGKHLNHATITHRIAGKRQQEYLIVKLEEVLISAVTHSGTADQPDMSAESVSLSFAKVHLEYRPQRPDGSLDAGIHFKYDLKNNKAF